MLKNNNQSSCGHNHEHSSSCGCSSKKHEHAFVSGVCECGMKEQTKKHENECSAEGCCCGHDNTRSEKHVLEEDSGGEDDESSNRKESKGINNAIGEKDSKQLIGILDLKPKDIQISNGEIVVSELIIEGLHCAGCASKIEKLVSELDEVKKVILNFATSTLTIHTNKENRKSAIKKASKIVVETEPGTSVREKNSNQTKEIEYVLQGLNCAGCAAKIEKKVNDINEIFSATLNFATSTLTVELKNNNIKNLKEEITKIVVDLEPHVKVIEKNNDFQNDVISNDKAKLNKTIIKFGIGIVGLVTGFIFRENSLSIVPFLISYLLIGGDIVLRSFKNIRRGEIFDENFLMTVATFAAIGVGEYPEAIMVMLLYQIGEYFQGKAVESSRKSITNLMDIRPDYANLKVDGQIKKVIPNEVNIGDIIIVKPGEKVPLDGVVVEGTSSVDTRALTGESVPQDVEEGDKITSGFINIDGLLTIKVLKTFKDSAVSKILDLVQNASAKKAKTELRITTFAKYYTPIVVFAALLFAIIPPIVIGDPFVKWIERAATFLVVSCPCALVISVPMTYFAGLGSASRKGVLVKGGNYLEALSNVNTIVFDKTGTLTEGKFKVADIFTTGEYSKEEILKYTAYAESYSNHPIAISIVNEYGYHIDKEGIKDYKEIRGKGVQANIDGVDIACGNLKFIKEIGMDVTEVKSAGTIVYTVINKKYSGHVVIKDQVKKDSKTAIDEFKNMGIANLVMLTGDRKLTAESAALELGIDNYYYELLPQDKVTKVEELINKKNEKDSLIFVGDGINDAPVLARADVGIAMGGVGSDAAIEAADVVIMNDEPSKIINAIRIAKKTTKIANQNIAFSLIVKVGILVLAAFGYANMMLAVFGDVGVALLAVFNAMRALKE